MTNSSPSLDLDQVNSRDDVEEYFDAVKMWTSDIKNSLDNEMEVEETVRKQANELEQLDEEVIQDLKVVLEDFEKYHKSMTVMMMELVMLRDEDDDINTSEEAVMEVSRRFYEHEGNPDKMNHNPRDTKNALKEIHQKLSDAVKALDEKEKDLSQIMDEIQKIADEDRDLEEETEKIEKILEFMNSTVNEWEEDFSNEF